MATSSCSPLYVMRAGWEEAGILLRRKDIKTIVADGAVDSELKRKLSLVLEARDYALQIGLKPKESFTKYSTIDRDVLVWVLTAAPPDALTPVTWWFPIVGSIPYKGFFEKEDADAEEKKLRDKGFDTFLRTSPAFSTLGWFNDPLLSTTIKFDDVALVDLVIHEVLHNTVWVKNHVEFNETLANVIGGLGAKLFFDKRDPALSKLAEQRLAGEMRFAEFLRIGSDRLTSLFKGFESCQPETPNCFADKTDPAYRTYVREERERVLGAAKDEWLARVKPDADPALFKHLSMLNNATILAHQTYLERPEVFLKLYEVCGSNIVYFVQALRDAEKELNAGDPYAATEALIARKLSEKAS